MVTKLSIITINRNHAVGLHKTIESVLSQTVIDLEFIIIDGASTDESIQLLNQYNDRITYWVSEPDKGIYNAMNKGICKAKGEYCLFLNSGDWLVDENVLEFFINHSHSADIVYGDVKMVDGNNQIKEKKYHSFVPYDLMIGTIVHQVIFFKRELFYSFGVYDETLKIAADWKFCLETILLHNCTVKHIDKFISFYDCTGVSSTMGQLDDQERKGVLSTYFDRQVIDDYTSSKLLDITQFFCFTRIVVKFLYFIISFSYPLHEYISTMSNTLPNRIKDDYIYCFKVNAILSCRYYRSLYYILKKSAQSLLRRKNIEIYY